MLELIEGHRQEIGPLSTSEGIWERGFIVLFKRWVGESGLPW